MDEWTPPRAPLGEPEPRHREVTLLRAVATGIAASLGMIIAVSVAIGIAIGVFGTPEQKTATLGEMQRFTNERPYILPALWITVMAFGGWIAARRSGSRWLRASALLGLFFLAYWGALWFVARPPITPLYLFTVGALVPAAVAGGALGREG